MNMGIRLQLGVGLLVASLFAGQGRASVLYTVPSLTVDGPHIVLADIVSNASGLPESWRNRIVADAPEPGEPIQLSLYTVADSLGQYADMKDIHLRGSVMMRVERRGVPVDFADVQRVVEDYVKRDERWAGRDVVVKCNVPEQMPLRQAGAADPKVLDCYALPGEQRYRFNLLNVSEETPVFALDVEIQELVPIWVAKRELPRGHLIAPTDLAVKKVSPDQASGVVSTGQSLVGMEVNRPIRMGHMIRGSYVLPPTVARSGDLIDVIARRNGLQVVMRMRALSSGRRGERIFCINEQSGQRVFVRLQDTRRAVLDF